MPSSSALAGLPRIPATPVLVRPPTVASSIPLTSGGTLNSLFGSTVTASIGAGTSLPSTGVSSLTNILPFTHPSLVPPTVGVYLGEGIPPVPDKLAAKIRRGEFVEMGELLPEFWSPRGDEGEVGRESKVRRSRKVTDIFSWLQCFGAYVSIRAPPAPHLIPELMAYMATIVRVSQDFAGLAWVRYDVAFRRQAAVTHNDRWSIINSTLYTMCFTGMASSTKRCELCFASTHTEQECAQRGDPDPGMKDRLKAIETAVLAITGKQEQAAKPVPPPVKPSGELCRKWNSVGCSYPRCRHSHICSSCRGNHPVTKCTMHPSQGAYNRASLSGGNRPLPPTRPL